MSTKPSYRRQTARRRRQLASVLATFDPKGVDLDLTPEPADWERVIGRRYARPLATR